MKSSNLRTAELALRKLLFPAISYVFGVISGSATVGIIIDIHIYHEGWYTGWGYFLPVPVFVLLFYIFKFHTASGLVWGATLGLLASVVYAIVRTLVPLESPYAPIEFMLFHVMLAQFFGLLGAAIWWWAVKLTRSPSSRNTK
jgi:hypothetical protein